VWKFSTFFMPENAILDWWKESTLLMVTVEQK